MSAILLTHAHNDHIGSTERLRTAYGTPILNIDAEILFSGHGPVYHGSAKEAAAIAHER